MGGEAFKRIRPVSTHHMQENNIIDVEQVIKSKSENWHKFIKKVPFLMSYIKKIMHQKELNEYLAGIPGVEGLDFVDTSIKFLNLHSEVYGINNLPEKNKRVVFVANHPIGGAESLHFIKAVADNYNPKLKSLSNDILLGLKPLQPLLVPVNNLGGKGFEVYTEQNYTTIDEVFASDESILIYPHGLVSKKKKEGVPYDGEWKKTFLSKARQYKRDYICPVHISGKLSNSFYRKAWISKNIFGAKKMGIETFYLVHEMVKQKAKNIDITFGETLPIEAFGDNKNKRNDNTNAQLVRDYVYTIGKEGAGAKFNYNKILKQ